MFRNFAKASGVLILLLLVNFMGCGDADKVGQIPAEEMLQISNVLDRWREGYETEDVNTYIGTFWEDGFLYVSDMGTDGDKTDDVEFDDIREERASATRVFERFQDIEIELSSPPEIQMNEDGTEAEVRNHYRIQFFVSDGQTLEGGYTGAYAEGDNLFIFEKRNDEWRIAEWHDEAFNEEEIRIANNL
ncbi:hypothetical protein C6503_11975 [Candidatus Poribacteria bacterium]|nr:MAG: hypothetical protein C6503_11975 [Candidatus Poribacteria bacterium]